MKSKKLNFGYADSGQVFWDETGTLITAIHENDGEFRDEYMSSLLNHFEIKVTFQKKIPKNIKKQSLDCGVWFSDCDD